MVVLQVALDFINAHRAIQIGKETMEGGADWLEAGTPLIKAEGLDIVRALKKFGKKVVADMKTMDVGALEVEMASKAGADIICIMGVASNETIKEGIKAARRYGSEIMIDLMRVDDVVKRAKEVKKMGADYVCIHVSIDEQMVGEKPFETVKKVSKEIDIPVAVAGGINSETAPVAVKNGAQIVIVGGAIIKAENVKEATLNIKSAIKKGKAIETMLFKKYDVQEIGNAFKKVSTSNICDAMQNKGALRGVFPVKKGYHMVGKALTVKTMDGDWAKAVEAIDVAEKGDVIIIYAGEGKQAVWGELATWSAIKKKLAGVVVYGGVRDVHEIVKTDMPVFAKKIVSEAGEPKGYGEIGVEISCEEQRVKKGDWIVGDDNGIVIVSKEEAQEIANRALNVYEKENRIREEIKRGSSLGNVLRIEKWEKIE
jgi:3-hexulose-6-phosphate synthase/6-phospho-3-hexuloisomerase